MNHINPYDFLSAVLLFYPGEQFENDREKIHTAFSEIRKEHSDLMRDIIFKENILFPRSKILDELFASLQPEFLGKLNPTYDRYQIKKDKLQKIWDLKLASILGSKKSELEQIASRLSKFLDHA